MSFYPYKNKYLEDAVNKIENRYVIEDAQEKYHNLVNFSQNSEVPYHKWFKYREGFAAELIIGLLSLSGINPGEVVVDPFCGSGTTNVVAAFDGYDTLGLDVNPMSAFITNAKVSTYSKSDIEAAKELLNTLTDTNLSCDKKYYSEIEKYFSNENFENLVKIKTFIDSTNNQNVKVILMVAFLSIVVDCSNRKRDGNGLKTVTSKISNVIDYYKEQVNLILDDICSHPLSENIIGKGVYESAFSLENCFKQQFPEKKVGTIIFSPPYANSFDYFESYKLELVFSDYAKGIKAIGNLRKKAVRSFVGASKQNECDEYVDLIAQEIFEAIPEKEKETGKKDSRTRKVPDMIRGYFTDMHEVIHQCSRCLDSGKRMYIVVDQSAYLGKIVPTDLLFSVYAEQEGMKVNKIIACRKARTSTQQLNKYPYLKSSLRESIIELEKI